MRELSTLAAPSVEMTRVIGKADKDRPNAGFLQKTRRGEWHPTGQARISRAFGMHARHTRPHDKLHCNDSRHVGGMADLRRKDKHHEANVG